MATTSKVSEAGVPLMNMEDRRTHVERINPVPETAPLPEPVEDPPEAPIEDTTDEASAEHDEEDPAA